MVCVVLAAGYATRLYPLTEKFPKPLLKVKDKTILDWLLDDVDGAGRADRYVIVSNHRYFRHFREWADTRRLSAGITVLDDGSESNESRLGAVKDILFAIDQLKLDDDLLILAGDNLLDFSLKNFLAYSRKKAGVCVMRFYESDEDRLRRTGVIQVDDTERVTRMEEKPPEPFDHWCVPPFYYYRRDDIRLIRRAIEDGCGTDAPGSLIARIAGMAPVYAMLMPGRRYDIGDLASYKAACNTYDGNIQ